MEEKIMDEHKTWYDLMIQIKAWRGIDFHGNLLQCPEIPQGIKENKLIEKLTTDGINY